MMPGIFEDQKSDMFVTYRVRLQFRNKIMGGIPMNPKMIEGWIRKKMGVGDELAHHSNHVGLSLRQDPLRQFGGVDPADAEDGDVHRLFYPLP